MLYNAVRAVLGVSGVSGIGGRSNRSPLIGRLVHDIGLPRSISPQQKGRQLALNPSIILTQYTQNIPIIG